MPPLVETVKLTEPERKILGLTAKIWNEYTFLDETHPNEF